MSKRLQSFARINRMFLPIHTKKAISKAGSDILKRQTRISDTELQHLDMLAEIDEGARIVESMDYGQTK